MGLIKAAVDSIGSTLHDQWKEVIRCENLGNDILMKKVTSPNGVISNGSTVVVGPGQCAIIYDNGRIVDATAEEGVYKFDSSGTPSLFAGQFGDMFKEMWERFTYNGATAKLQAVYYFNITEITDNKFGTPTPINYKDWGHPIVNARTNSYIGMSVNLRCHGKYTFRIEDPFTFLSKFAGIEDVVTKEKLTEQLRSEVIDTFSELLSLLGSDEYKVEALQLKSKSELIRKLMNEHGSFNSTIENRGVKIVSFSIELIALDDESQEKINNYEVGGDVYSQQGVLTGAYASALKDAANNSGGAMNGMFGIGMMNMASGNAFGNAAAGAFTQAKPMQPQEMNLQQQQQPTAAPSAAALENVQTSNDVPSDTDAKASTNTWICSNCNKETDGKFCPECGMKKPEEQTAKKCPQCGNELKPDAKFCSECGTKVE